MSRGFILLAAGALIAALGVVVFYEFRLCKYAPQASLLCRSRAKPRRPIGFLPPHEVC
jgi:hypothetical protein